MHPDIDPAEITTKLGLQPRRTMRRGEPRETPKGTPLEGVYRDTRWTWSDRDARGRKLREIVSEVVDQLPAGSSFWSELAEAGGSAELILALDGATYLSDTIGVDIIRKLAAMGIKLGIEVYSEPQDD